MISYPKQGQLCVIWYAKKKRPFAPYHGEPGMVIIPGLGKPKNHLILTVSGDLVVVPSGNLMKENPEWAKQINSSFCDSQGCY